MTDRHVDDLLADLRSALDVQPSPGFAAGVRARIEQPRASFWSWRTIAAGTALGAAAVVAALMFVRPQPSVETAAPVAASTAVTPAVPPAPSTVAPEAPAGVAATTPTARLASAGEPGERAASRSEPFDPLTVVTDQQEILQRMWASAGPARVSEEEFGRALQIAASTEIVPLDIDEIVVPPVSGFDGMGPLPVGVMPTIRRVQDSDAGRSLR